MIFALTIEFLQYINIAEKLGMEKSVMGSSYQQNIKRRSRHWIPDQPLA
jgi:hypothetical protein